MKLSKASSEKNNPNDQFYNRHSFPSAPGRGGVGGGAGRGFARGGPVVKAKNFKGTMLRLWRFFGRERKMLSVIFSFIIADALLGLSVPFLIGKSIDTMTSKTGNVNFRLLSVYTIILVIYYIIDTFIGLAQGWLMASTSQKIIKTLRNTLFEKLQSLPVAFFDRHTHGEIMSRLTNDIENVSSTLSQATTQLMSSAITISGSLILMLILSPLLTLACMVTVPLVFLLTKMIAKNTSKLFKEQQKVLGRLNGYIEESISGINTIKAFNREGKIIKEFESINDVLCGVGLKAQIISGFMMPIMNVINNIGFAAVAGIGGVLAVKNIITVGVIASFISYSRQFTRPLIDLANIFNSLQSAIAGAERVFDILDEEEEPADIENAMDLPNIKGHVVFNDVTFGYREEVPVLKNINLEALPGTNIALVGPTGAGKTTIVNLISRFYDINSGEILIDGIDIRNLKRDSLRKYFGIVLQDTYLFSGTIKENIKYGKTNADDIEIIEAAKTANADKFIKRLPNGYDTILTESGSNLSQGQRQLIAIARAVLSNPSILILDEATSNVDTRTELHIQEAMLKLMKGRTSFIIAHRLSTIRDADIILFIEDGEIKEKGTHESLLSKRGKYYDLYYSQFKKIIE